MYWGLPIVACTILTIGLLVWKLIHANTDIVRMEADQHYTKTSSVSLLGVLCLEANLVPLYFVCNKYR